MFEYFVLENFNFKDKIIGVRVDINSPIFNNKIKLNERIIAHSKTIKEIAKKGGKVVILAHQGRKGSEDCISLKTHSELISKEINLKVNFIPELYSDKVKNKILNLKSGEILLLENLRFYDDETNLNKKENKLLKLEKIFDYYVFDAFSVAHRKQTSVNGMKKVISIAGKVMEKELKGLNKLTESETPRIYVFGGAKPDDLIELLEINLKENKIDLILLTGIIGEIALYLKGFNIGKKLEFLKEKNFLNSELKLKKLLEKYKDKIILPKDVALISNNKRIEIRIENLEKEKKLLKNNLIEDIGEQTIKFFNLLLKDVGSIYFKGPAGNFEKKDLDIGSKGILKSITSSNAFTFMGGGHSVTAAKNFGVLNKFSYVSLAGGALVKFLSGKKLVGVENLEESYHKNEKYFADFIVVGSNVVDTDITIPVEFNQMHLGDKIKVNEDFKYTVGGGGINVSLALSRLGGKVDYLGKFSYETYDKIKTTLNKNKINIIETKISKKPAAKSVLIDTKDGDRLVLTYLGQNSFLESKDFNLKNFNSDYFYFTSLTGKSLETLLTLSKTIKKNKPNSIICYNPSLYLIKTETKKIKQLLKNIDILILNYEEAEFLIGFDKIGICLKKLKEIVNKIVIITDGSNGAYLYDGKKEYFQKASKPKKIIDTTGAGDSFAATFFYFYLKGYELKKAMEIASKNSANVISYKGAQEGLMYFEDIMKIIKKN